MEEDIKILEEFIKNFYESFAPEIIIYNPEIKALENLIKSYRELEESKITRERVNDIQEETKRIVNETYIPKSKIKEELKKIDQKEKQELKGMKGQDRYFVKQMYQYMKKPLQELLEEE